MEKVQTEPEIAFNSISFEMCQMLMKIELCLSQSFCPNHFSGVLFLWREIRQVWTKLAGNAFERRQWRHTQHYAKKILTMIYKHINFLVFPLSCNYLNLTICLFLFPLLSHSIVLTLSQSPSFLANICNKTKTTATNFDQI